MVATAVMSSNSAVDLALLGLLAEQPRPAHELIESIKLVGGDRFTPTSAFIEGRVAHLIEAGCLERQDDRDRLSVTRSGRAHLMRLLCLEIDAVSATLRTFCTTLKLSLLDRVGAECRREVLATLIDAGRRRASRLEMAQWAGCGCAMMERYLALEQEREALELRWMQDVLASQGMADGVGEGLSETVA